MAAPTKEDKDKAREIAEESMTIIPPDDIGIADPKKRLFLQALRASLGVITDACVASGVPRTNVYYWKKKDPEFERILQEITEEAGDFVRTALYKKIREGDTVAILFYCKTKLRKDGFSERMFYYDNIDLPKIDTNENILLALEIAWSKLIDGTISNTQCETIFKLCEIKHKILNDDLAERVTEVEVLIKEMKAQEV